MKTKQTKSKQQHVKTTKHMNRWRRDFATDLPVIPQGAFVPASECLSDADACTPDTSVVLRGDFDASRFDIETPNLPGKIEVGWDAVGNKLPSLVFRVQCGADMLCWYANPADPYIWRALDVWNQERRLTLSYRPNGEPDILFGSRYQLHQKLEELQFLSTLPKEARAGLTAGYLEAVCAGIVSGEVERKTKSILPAYPRLKNLQACIVRTSETQSVVVNVVDEKPGESFLKAVLRRGVELAAPPGTRH
ncbi:hypothetical protein [Variovorax sp. Sphag1AA]|uniref:hypothetical protein n=1 Tax=Variovorax sp. Sphag1AA TaxID=2587027 RepID=UPI0016146CFA|nr:hypothetical protein [Variovorax sp. Sphag1AA]MBB3181157.1 hypothetical protein [Variovorax sp. Sphag1AA]